MAKSTKVIVPEVEIEEIELIDMDEEIEETEVVLVTDEEIAELTKDVATKGTVTPKEMAAQFHIDQKVVRRHLRKHFGTDSGHEYRANWSFQPTDPMLKLINAHFASKYPTTVAK